MPETNSTAPSTTQNGPPWTTPNGNTATYTLHCHCASVVLTITLSPPLYASETTPSQPDRAIAVECDCSHCQRNGIRAVHPLSKDVKFLKGVEDGNRGEYWFGARKNPHWFCKVCGGCLGSDLGETMRGFGAEERCCINVRMLKDYDASKILVREVRGMKGMNGKYEPQI